MELIFDNLSIGYGKQPLFSGLNAKLLGGESLAVLGCNGTGKSSLLKIMGEFQTPYAGSIHDGSGKAFDKEIISYLPQTYDLNKDVPITINEFVALGKLAKKANVKGPKVNEAMKEVGLEAQKNNLIGQISLGQFVRACIARNLMQEAQIIILDEPFASLDKESSQEIMDLLAKLKAQGKIIIVSIHDEKLAAGFDHFLTLDGKQAKWEYKSPIHSHDCALHDCKSTLEIAI